LEQETLERVSARIDHEIDVDGSPGISVICAGKGARDSPRLGVETGSNEIAGLAAMPRLMPRRAPPALAHRSDRAEVHLRGRARIDQALRSRPRQRLEEPPLNASCGRPAGTG
jgi:hypothetical protein